MFLILFQFLYISIAGSAQTETGDTTGVQFEEVVIHGERMLNFSNTELKNIKIERNNFLHISGQTFLDNLSGIPGIQLAVTGTNVTKPIIRGMTLSRVWGGENHVKQEGQQWGMDHGLELDPFTEGDITIIKGPSNILFGPDAVGGVINVERPQVYETDTQSLSLMTIHRSVNDLWGMYAQYKLSRKNFYMKTQASYHNYAAYKVPSDSFIYNTYILPIDKRRLINTSGHDANAALQLGYQYKTWNFYTNATYYYQKAGLFKGAFGRPQSMDLSHGESLRMISEPLQLTRHAKVLLSLSKDCENSSIDNIFSFQLNDRQELSSHRHVNQTDSRALDLNLVTFQNALKYKYRWADNQITQISYEFMSQNNSVQGYEFLVPSYSKTQHGFYIYHSVFSIPRHKIVIGLRADRISYMTDNAFRYLSNGGGVDTVPAHEAFERHFFNTNIQINWDYRMSRSSVIQMNISRVNRTPNIAELASNGIHHGTFRHESGDRDLDSEKGILFDAGCVVTHEKWDMHVTPYFYYFSNYIYLTPTAFFSTLPEAGQIFRYQQTRAILTGLEYQWSWNYRRNLRGEINAEYVYAANLESGYGLPLTPPLSLMKSLEYTMNSSFSLFSDMVIRYTAHFYSAQQRIDKYERTTPAYFLNHISLEKRIHIHPKHHIKLDLEVRNIFNTAYLNHLSRYRILNMPEPGRNISLSLKYLM